MLLILAQQLEVFDEILALLLLPGIAPLIVRNAEYPVGEYLADVE